MISKCGENKIYISTTTIGSRTVPSCFDHKIIIDRISKPYRKLRNLRFRSNKNSPNCTYLQFSINAKKVKEKFHKVAWAVRTQQQENVQDVRRYEYS